MRMEILADDDPAFAPSTDSLTDSSPALTTAEVLHVLRTSTAVALAYAQLLQRRWRRGTLDQDQFERGTAAIEQACGRLSTLAGRIERSELG
jgi:hypothetical protein